MPRSSPQPLLSSANTTADGAQSHTPNELGEHLVDIYVHFTDFLKGKRVLTEVVLQ